MKKVRANANPKKIVSTPKKPIDSTIWKKLQCEYSQTAKDMFEKASDQMRSATEVVENRKRMLARLNANVAVNVVKSIASLQGQFVKQTFKDINAMTRRLVTRKLGKPADSFVHLDIMKGSLQRVMEHADNMESILSESRREMHDQINDRFNKIKRKMKSSINKRRK